MGAVMGPGDDGMGNSGHGHLQCLEPLHIQEFTSVCVEGLLGREGREGLPSAWGLLGVLVPICSRGPDHWRQGSPGIPTVQLHRGALKPGLSPGLVLPGSRPDGSQKDEGAASMGSV